MFRIHEISEDSSNDDTYCEDTCYEDTNDEYNNYVEYIHNTENNQNFESFDYDNNLNSSNNRAASNPQFNHTCIQDNLQLRDINNNNNNNDDDDNNTIRKRKLETSYYNNDSFKNDNSSNGLINSKDILMNNNTKTTKVILNNYGILKNKQLEGVLPKHKKQLLSLIKLQIYLQKHMNTPPKSTIMKLDSIVGKKEIIECFPCNV
jgi:hypothetical protein